VIQGGKTADKDCTIKPATMVSLNLQGVAWQCDDGNRGGSDVATRQEVLAASRHWKGQGKNSPLKLPEGMQPN